MSGYIAVSDDRVDELIYFTEEIGARSPGWFKAERRLMPLLHLRVCNRCDATRFAGCSTTCGVPLDSDPQSWRVNLQEGAGTLPKGGCAWRS